MKPGLFKVKIRDESGVKLMDDKCKDWNDVKRKIKQLDLKLK